MLGRLSTELENPGAIAEYVKTYLAERRALAAKTRRNKAKVEAELGACARGVATLVDALADETMTKAEIKPRPERKFVPIKRDCKAELANAEDGTNVVDLHPKAIARFRENLEGIAASIRAPGSEIGDELSARFRELIDSVTVMPRKAYEEYRIELKGRLSALFGATVWPRAVGYSAGAG